MHVIIIGNGFDLNLGFATGYGDFIQSEQFKKISSGKQNALAAHLKQTYDINNWIDVENEFENFSAQFISSKLNVPHKSEVKKDYLEIKQALIDYLKSIDFTRYGVDSKAYRILKDIHIRSQSDTIIYDFNYTPSVSNILRDNKLVFVKHTKVHGSLAEDNIVFGVSDDTKIHNDHIFFRKSATKIFPAVNLIDDLSGAIKISIFGHSLGNMDYDYFKDFFIAIVRGTKMNSSIDVYYKGDNDLDEINARLFELTDRNLSVFKQKCRFNEIEC